MEQQIKTVTTWLKQQDIKGCITGSTFLEYFEGADVDLFVYDEASFNAILFAMHHNDMFNIVDDLEKWKFLKWIKQNNKSDFGITTIKFTYNTSVPVNIILKKGCKTIFDVLSSFDMDIISKGYDIETKQILDLSGDSQTTKIASFNLWNNNFYSPELWQASRILRQLDRVIKYYKRGYNTDPVAEKYIDIMDDIIGHINIFNSDNFTEKLRIKKENAKIVKKICQKWLETHEINDKQLEILKKKLKEI